MPMQSHSARQPTRVYLQTSYSVPWCQHHRRIVGAPPPPPPPDPPPPRSRRGRAEPARDLSVFGDTIHSTVTRHCRPDSDTCQLIDADANADERCGNQRGDYSQSGDTMSPGLTDWFFLSHRVTDRCQIAPTPPSHLDFLHLPGGGWGGGGGGWYYLPSILLAIRIRM